MVQTTPAEMCRLAVHGPRRRIEVAVPVGVLVADLLPVLLQHLGENLPDAGLAHGGWVLQRMGGDPLDEENTVAASGLRDGDAVHLRPRSDQIPPVNFDDVADGIATGVRGRSGLWRPAMIRWTALGLFVLVHLVALTAIGLPAPVPARVVAAAMVALVDLAGAFALVRGVGERAFGLAAAIMAIAGGGLAGLLLPGAAGASAGPVDAATRVFAAAVAAAVTALAAGAVVGVSGPFFTGIVTAVGVTGVGAALTVFAGLARAEAAAVVAVAGTVSVAVVPLVAFRLARITMTPLPTQPEHLQEDIDPVPSEGLLSRTATADRYMTALHAGLGVAVTAALLLVVGAGGLAGIILALLVAVLSLLMLRPLTSGWHRLSLAVPAVSALAGLAVRLLADSDLPVRLVAVALVPFVGVGLVVAARALPDRRLTPYWGRAGDIIQLLTTVALLPVLLAVLDVYAALRALGG